MATLKAVRVSPNKFIRVATLTELQGNSPDPRKVDLSTEKERSKSSVLSRAYEQRGSNQRKFDKSRIVRAVDYALYIKAVDFGGRMGDYPPVTLWTQDECYFDEIKGELKINGNSILTANDGETQLAARYFLIEGFSEKGYAQEIIADSSLLDSEFAVVITTKSSKEEAMQTLHDMNHYATPVSEKTTAALNIEGGLTKAINKGLDQNDTRGSVKSRGNITTRETFKTTHVILMHGAIGAMYGKECNKVTPNKLIAEANRQFSKLNGKADLASGFVADIMHLSSEVLRHVDDAHMMALGMKYNETSRISQPLTKEQYANLEEALKVERNGRRADIRVRANAVFEQLI